MRQGMKIDQRQKRYSQRMRGSMNRAIYWAALITLSVQLLGCAGGLAGKQVEPAEKVPVVDEEAGVTPLSDGRTGFVIREVPQRTAEWQDDFVAAIGHLQAEDFSTAAELLENVVAQSPDVTAPYINLAIAFRKLNKLELAEKQLKTALELFPAHPVASNEYGLLLRSTGRFAEARSVYEQALSMFPHYTPLRRNLGILCDLYLQDLSCALDQYEQYGAANPDDEQVQLWVADLRMRLGQ